MIIYDDFTPEVVTLHGLSIDGIPISLNIYLSPDKKTMIPQVFTNYDKEYARKSFSTHKRCKCGNVHEINSYCEPCKEKEDFEKYISLPVVPMSFPCFVNDKFYEEKEYLDDDIADGEIDISKARIYTAKILDLYYDLQETISDFLCDNFFEDSLEIDVSDIEVMLNKRLKTLTPVYIAVTYNRMVYNEEKA